MKYINFIISVLFWKKRIGQTQDLDYFLVKSPRWINPIWPCLVVLFFVLAWIDIGFKYAVEETILSVRVIELHYLKDKLSYFQLHTYATHD